MTAPTRSQYQQVADTVRARIRDGTYIPGERLPSNTELAREFGLSQPPVNKALGQLATEGLVTITSRRSTIVRERRPVQHVSSRYTTVQEDGEQATWSTELERQGFRGGQTVEPPETVAASREVAEALHLTPERDEVVVRQRVMYLEGDPVQLADSHYPVWLAAGTELAAGGKMPGGTVAALGRAGYTPSWYEEQISARMPTTDEVDALGLPPGTPVVRHTRVTWSADTPVEYSVAVCAGDQHVFNYGLPAEL